MIDSMSEDAREAPQVLRRNNVNVSGMAGSRAIVLGHGFGNSQSMWRSVAPVFEAEHEVVLFDHVGSGDSDHSAYERSKYDSLHGYARDLIEVIEATGKRDVAFVGHSVSGMIGVLAAIARPDLFRSLVLVGASPRYTNDGDYVGGLEPGDVDGLLDAIDSNFEAWADAAVPTLVGEAGSGHHSAELLRQFRSSNATIIRHFARVTYLSDFRSVLGDVTTPTLVVQSLDDSIAPLTVGHYLRDHIPGARLVELGRCGHYAHLVRPDALAAAIRDAVA